MLRNHSAPAALRILAAISGASHPRDRRHARSTDPSLTATHRPSAIPADTHRH